jgi:hypothetical protein
VTATLKSVSGDQITLDGTQLTCQLSGRSRLRRTIRTAVVQIDLADVRAVLTSRPHGITMGWIWLLNAADPDQPARAPEVDACVYRFFARQQPDADALLQAMSDATDGRLTPRRVTSDSRGVIAWPVNPLGARPGAAQRQIVTTGETVLYRRGLLGGRKKHIVVTSTRTTSMPTGTAVPAGVRARVQCPTEGCGHWMVVSFPNQTTSVTVDCSACGASLSAIPPAS